MTKARASSVGSPISHQAENALIHTDPFGRFTGNSKTHGEQSSGAQETRERAKGKTAGREAAGLKTKQVFVRPGGIRGTIEMITFQRRYMQGETSSPSVVLASGGVVIQLLHFPPLGRDKD